MNVSATLAPSISIHAPREGGDDSLQVRLPHQKDFNPRPPREGGDISGYLTGGFLYISIHAPPRGGRRLRKKHLLQHR